MIELIYGTSNPAKVKHMRKIVNGMEIIINGLKDIDNPILSIDEVGNSPLDNARIKAMAYYSELKRPVFSCDSGLYIDGLSNAEQPGVYIRRVNGIELSDDELIDHYALLAEKINGGSIKAKYVNAICLIINDNEIYEYCEDDIASEDFIISSIPHEKRIKGVPLDTLSIDITTGKYYFDLEQQDINIADTKMTEGFRKFFDRVLLNNKIMVS